MFSAFSTYNIFNIQWVYWGVTPSQIDPLGQNRNLKEPQKLSYLLVGVRPVKAQEKVRGLAVQEEVGCPEWDGEALDGVAEVKRGPEVLGISICKDVLQGKEESSEQSLAAPKHPFPSRV